MTRENVKKNMDIISAFAEDKVIQIITEKGEWVDLTERDGLPIETIAEDPSSFRIKPEPKYRPFRNAKECWAEMQKHQPFGYVNNNGCYACILSVSNIDVSIMNASGDIITPSFGDLVEDITFADGTPFGVKVEE